MGRMGGVAAENQTVTKRGFQGKTIITLIGSSVSKGKRKGGRGTVRKRRTTRSAQLPRQVWSLIQPYLVKICLLCLEGKPMTPHLGGYWSFLFLPVSLLIVSGPLKGFFILARCPSRALYLDSCVDFGNAELKGHRQVYRTRL